MTTAMVRSFGSRVRCKAEPSILPSALEGKGSKAECKVAAGRAQSVS